MSKYVNRAAVLLIAVAAACANERSEIRFSGIDYKAVSVESYSSKNHDLKGISHVRHNISVDVTIPLLLRSRTTFMSGFTYQNDFFVESIDESRREIVKEKIPEYLYNFPVMHKFVLSAMIDQQIRSGWGIFSNVDLQISSDLKGSPDKKDFSSIIDLLLVKRWTDISLGAGGALYLFHENSTFLPLLYFEYAGRRTNTELVLPLGGTFDFNFGKRSMIGVDAEVILTGYSITTETSSIDGKSPDYINNRGVDIALVFDQRIFGSFHYELSAGIEFRDVEFLEENYSIDTLTFRENLSLGLGIYATF